MPRHPRLDIAGVPQHVTQVGADSATVFESADDCRFYLELVGDASRAAGCDIHAYALAASRVQLLVTGRVPGAVARVMRRVGLTYARYANARIGKRGACWRGRYLSCPVGGHQHILLACGHVERAGQTSSLGTDRSWSSHASNAYGADDRLVTPHPAYAALGHSDGERMHRYRQLVERSCEIDEALAMHTRQGRAWGSGDFLREVASTLGEQAPARPPGRPRKRVQTVVTLPVFLLSPFLLTGCM